MRKFVSIRINLQCFAVLLALTLIFVACDSGENNTVNATQSGDDYVYGSYQELVLKANCNKITEWVEVRVVNEGVYTCMQSNDSWRWNRACEYKGVKHADGSGWMDGCVAYLCSSGYIVPGGGYGGGMCPGRSSSSIFRSSWSISSSSSLNQGTFLSSSMIRGLSISSSSNAEIHAISSSAVKNSIIYGSLVDNRDGQIYKTVTIGSQTWMAENLAYEYKVDGITYGNGTVDSHKEYGYYYTWVAAMDSAGVFSANGMGCGYRKTCSPTYPVRGICPEGWHLPDSTEWKTLYSALNRDLAAMQAVGYDGWPDATNASGFSALPAGYYSGGYNYGYVGSDAAFWSATEYDAGIANYWYMYAGYAGLDGSNKNDGYSVRCLKD